MSPTATAARVAVSGPHPLLTVTIERRVVVVADVRRCADGADPVDCRLAGHGHAVAFVERPVVDAGQYVAVEVDHVTPSPAGSTARPSAAAGAT